MSQRKSCLPRLFKILCQFAQTTTSQSKDQIKRKMSFYNCDLTLVQNALKKKIVLFQIFPSSKQIRK